jgi:predicted ATPase/GAF domain-containing protein/tRNA A-37 threonylcarbamoyl transferase component Bud32
MIDLPHYTLAETAYEGAETVVYRGSRDADLARVAVKVTRSEYPTARQLARLRREFVMLRELDIPGVVRAYALERCGRGLALVMEDLGACSLHDLIARQELDLETTLRIALSLAGTLAALHERHIIHKDIKPRNIMIEEGTYEPHLVDLGMSARLSREIQKATSPDSLEGTLAYISPEQTGSVNRAVDLRSDLYSFGVTLYEMLTGSLPFPSADPVELLHGHIARVPTPPHERALGVPRALSDIVMRLLAKAPEDRYQTARGLGTDLAECLRQWNAGGQIAPFALGRTDVPGELRISQKLYGREREIDLLLSAFERARRGTVELFLVSGYSGVGKTALVNELHKPIARQGGFFVRGKFDEVRRDIPVAPVAHALRALIRQVLMEPPSALLAWKAAILAAVGANGRLLFELTPELELLLGPQPEAPPCGPNEARNRFALVLQSLLRVFATATHPLAIFLDDLQWADPGSLELIRLLLSDPDSGHLLLIGAYRDNEVDAAHPLTSALEKLREAGVAMTAVTLGPLDLPMVTRLVADTLRTTAQAVEPLCAALFDKTQGNPFFLGQLLHALDEQGLVALDVAAGCFRWDLERIRATGVADNVADLLVGKLGQLRPATQRALRLASCIGHEFDLRTLSTVLEEPPAGAAADLWEALMEGLLVPLDSDYRLLDAGASEAPAAADFEVSYSFLHDRVLQTVYALIDQEDRQEVHLKIGRLLWAEGGEDPHDDQLLEIVRHLNLGARRIEDKGERRGLARLNLRAGRKAKAATAFQAAAGYFGAGMDLLEEADWTGAYDLCFALHREAAECECLGGSFERAEALFDALLPRARSDLERARIHDLRVVFGTTLGRFAAAVKAGREGLALLGVKLPETDAEQEEAFPAALAEVAENLGGRSIRDLIDAPIMDDPEMVARLTLLSDVALPIYFVNPAFYGVAVLRQVNISLKYGHSNVSAFSYMAYGFMVAVLLGRPSEGYEYGRLAMALNEKLPNPALTPKLCVVFCGFLHTCQHLSAVTPYFQRAREAALQAGDFVYLSNASYGIVANQLGAGRQLEDVRKEVERGIAVVRRTKDIQSTSLLTLERQMIACLEGKTKGRTSLSDDAFDEDEFVARLGKEEALAFFFVARFRLELRYLHGDFAGALAAAREAEPWSASALGMYAKTEVPFYACLSLLSLPPPAAPEDRARHEEAIARHRSEIADLAAKCPKNYQDKLLLIEAEAARAAGRRSEAMELYDQAIARARQNDFAHIEAMANEHCAKFYLGLGRTRIARAYMTDAYLGYAHWGATSKAEDIARDYPEVVHSAGGAGHSKSVTASSSATATILSRTTVASLRDAALVVRAAQAVAGEIVLPKIIDRLMRIVLENAGAQRAALLLLRGGRLFVEATFRVEPDTFEIGPSKPLDLCGDLPQRLLLYVARTSEPVVVDDAGADAQLSDDPYVAANRPRSILCLPLLHQGRLGGVLYLENNALAGAFTHAGVELLGLLSSQAAIAIENALLVAGVQAANDEVRRANERLESEVAKRTDDLRRSAADLARSNEELNRTARRLEVELAQRVRAEEERAAIQEQMFEAQRARLSELSTPLIPITDEIVVMPLIGAVDAERAAQVLEVALEGAQRAAARVVILDITGMRQIDSGVAATLVKTATALGLLGTQAVLTGVRPEVAQALVGLGIDLESIVTKGTLQDGIAYALRRTGRPGAFGSRR